MPTVPVCEIAGASQDQTSPCSTIQTASLAVGGVIVATFLTAGTGGFASRQAFASQTFTGSVAPVCSVGHSQQEDADLAAAVQEKIAGIRHYLSLNTTELAAVLQVKRPTVYSWAAGAVAVKSKHRARLNQVYEIARDWRALSPKQMGQVLREPLEGGAAMIDLLTADKLDRVAIRNAMLRAREFQDRVARRLTVTEVAKKAGVKLASRSRRNWPSSGDIDI